MQQTALPGFSEQLFVCPQRAAPRFYNGLAAAPRSSWTAQLPISQEDSPESRTNVRVSPESPRFRRPQPVPRCATSNLFIAANPNNSSGFLPGAELAARTRTFLASDQGSSPIQAKKEPEAPAPSPITRTKQRSASPKVSVRPRKRCFMGLFALLCYLRLYQ